MPALLVVSAPASADQYRTHIQEVPSAQTKAVTPQDLKRQLKQQQGSPYGRALILRHLAGLAAADKNYAQARKYLEQAVALDALAPAAQSQMRAALAQLQAAAGDWQGVVKTMAPLIASGAPADAVDPQAWLALGNAYAQLGQWDKAAEPLRHAVQVGGRNEAMYRLQLGVSLQAGNLDQAAKALRGLLGLAPDKKAYWLQLAAVNAQRGAHQAAVAVLEVAWRRGMLDTAQQRLQLIRAYLESGAPFSAARRLAGWMQAGQVPVNAANYRLLAAAWVRAREFARAVSPLARAAAASGDAELYAQLGQLHMDLAQWKPAVRAFEQALKAGGIGADTGRLLLSLGLARYQLGQGNAAHRAFARAGDYDQAAKLAGQWLAFLDARPADLAPLEMQALGGGGPVAPLPANSQPAAIASAQKQAGQALPPLPPGVPKTADHLTPVGAVRAGNAA
ncbi:MAG: tetratricopeptide repeat protein, partial [Salinisphaera sp.]|nr:tetratricopeptide repeat protein [Salinisphaera sp.]